MKGAEKAGEFLNYGTPKVIAQIQPDPEPKPISPRVKKSLKVAKDVTGTAVQVTGYVGEMKFHSHRLILIFNKLLP